MTSVVLYMQAHQPFRLRRYSVFDTDPFVFDNDLNQQILEKVATKCYRPATRTLLDLVKRHDGRFRISFAITGTALEQFRLWAPDVIELFQQLTATGACEILAETSHHSLSFIYSREEFSEQLALHDKQVRDLFDQTPTTFRNTELIYSNDIATHLAGMGRYSAILCEGLDRVLGERTPNSIYAPPSAGRNPAQARVRLLLKNHRLSDDIAFRFSNRNWSGWPLSAATFAECVDAINADGSVCNLFIDYETLGEHHWEETGIFEFLNELPEKVLEVGGGRNDFLTPSEAVAKFEPVGEYDVPFMSSWADTERDLSAWLGNAMQDNAAAELYKLEQPVKAAHVAGDEYILEDWRKLTTSDHLYYMSTKHWADGDVHKYFSPYDSPYDAYINFMNVLDNLRKRAGGI